MDRSIFRKSSIDRMNSPEQLNEYIRVARPSVWILLGSIVCLLMGVVIWGVFGYIDTKLESGAVSMNGEIFCYVSPEDAEKLKSGLGVTIDGIDGAVSEIATAPIQIDETFDTGLLYLSGLTQGDFCYLVKLDVPNLPDGTYKISITVDRISPISFIIH